MTEREATLLDLILHEAENKPPFAYMEKYSDFDSNEFHAAGDFLKKNNFGIYVGNSDFQIFPEGISFIKGDSFLTRYNDEQKRQSVIDSLNEETLKAAKREPMWKIISIIGTISGAIIGSLITYLLR